MKNFYCNFFLQYKIYLDCIFRIYFFLLIDKMIVQKLSRYVYVNVLIRGDLLSLYWVEFFFKFFFIKFLCFVSYVVFNFRDVMLVIGRLSFDVILGDLVQ